MESIIIKPEPSGLKRKYEAYLFIEYLHTAKYNLRLIYNTTAKIREGSQSLRYLGINQEHDREVTLAVEQLQHSPIHHPADIFRSYPDCPA